LILVSLVASSMCGQFHPNKSTSFYNEEQLFKVEYLDDASLTGFVAKDVVQLGSYYVNTRFGCVTKSKGHDWAQADGILGMGFPAAALRSVPYPLFWALTDPTKADEADSNILMNRVFTLMLSEDRGELVLGGYDPSSVKGNTVTTGVRASPLGDGTSAFMHYMIDVQSLKIGDHELLQFRDESIAIQAILDSGTSCLVVPDDTFEGGLLASPFKTFQKYFGDLDEPTIYITIEGQTFSLPYDDYMVDDKPCVMKMKSTPRTFLLGDVFFRRMVVVHDLNDPAQPKVTLGQRAPGYQLTTQFKKIDDRNHVPLGKKKVLKPQPMTIPAIPIRPEEQGHQPTPPLSQVASEGIQPMIPSPSTQQVQYQSFVSHPMDSGAAMPLQQGSYPAANQYAPPQYVSQQGRAGAYPVQNGMMVSNEEPPLHNPSLGGQRRLLGFTHDVERIPMTTSNSYIYYAILEVGTPRQKGIHVILDTGSSVFAIFAVPHGGPSLLVICLLVAACILGATSIGLLALSWYQGTYEEMEESLDPLLGQPVEGSPL